MSSHPYNPEKNQCNSNATNCSIQRMKAIALLRKAIRENISLAEMKTNLLKFACFQSDNHIFCPPLKRQSFDFDNIFLEALQKEEQNFF